MSTSNATPVMLPSRSGLLLRLGGALVVASVILVAFVLPAEYQIDPTGFGKHTGLVKMSQTQAAPPAATPTPVMNTTAAHTYSIPFRTDDVDIPIGKDGELEYKVHMQEGGTLIYSWKCPQSLYIDFHGESDKEPGKATSYTVTQEAKEGHGSLTAPFTGIHGWFFQNQTDIVTVIHVKMSGFYELIKETPAK
jgi:hypothetical protein